MRQLPTPITTSDELNIILIEELREISRKLSAILGNGAEEPQKVQKGRKGRTE